MLDADIEIFNWVLQAEESATASADREVESWLRDIPEEDQALEPMHHDNADSDDEAVKVQALTMDDRILARRKGLSEEHDQEWQDATYAAEDEDEDFKGWDLIEDDKRPPGVVASDPVHEEEKELDLERPRDGGFGGGLSMKRSSTTLRRGRQSRLMMMTMTTWP